MTKRLDEDHKNAKYLASELSQLNGFEVDYEHLDINMVFVKSVIDLNKMIGYLLSKDIILGGYKGEYLRIAIHNDISRVAIDLLITEIKNYLVKIQNGQYALKNQKVSGIHVVIQKEVPPSYPDLALKMGYRKETIVKVKFLVDEKGHVGDIKFYTNSKYGFEVEVEKALKNWVFEPILYQKKPMPIYFYKVFHFVSKN